MNKNEKFIIESFKNNFEAHKNKNILLYGTNANTCFILQNFSEYNFIGLLDGTKKNEYIYGKYIYDINDIPGLEPYMIIIVARATTVRVIKRRIENFCVKNNIKLFDIAGNDLLDSESFSKENTYFSVNETQLMEQIKSHEAISFDIFDTLIMRRVLYPKDVFDIVANEISDFDFKSERIRAEQEILKSINPNIDQIYERLMSNCGLSFETAQKIKNNEIEAEKKVLIQRQAMVRIFEYAKSLNKKITLISDMYLNKKILVSLLDDLGISGYDDIMVSCDYNTSKSENLFNEYIKLISANSYLHIGDNEYSDGRCAVSNGIDSFLIKSSYDMADISSYSAILKYDENFDSRLHLGIFLSEIFNDPFSLYNSDGKYLLEKNNEIGLYFAPLATEFIIWLIHKIKYDNCENVLFSSRDGYLIKKLYEIAAKSEILPDCKYFLASRMACISAGIENEQDIVYAVGRDFSGTPEELIEKRFFVDKSKIKKYEVNQTLNKYVIANADEIYISAEKCRKNYQKYIESQGIEFSKKTAFFDFASSGTCQMCIEKIMKTKLYGYYFMHIYDDYELKQNLRIKSMIKPSLSFENQSNLYDKYAFIETILTSDKPSLKRFDDNGNPIYVDEYRTVKHMKYISDIHDSILNYFEIFFSLYLKKECDRISLADEIFGLLDESKTILSAEYLQKSIFKDEYCMREYNIKSMV